MAWFKATSLDLIGRVDGYLTVLAAHGVACERIESSNPGKIIYEDPDQVVVTPWRNAGAGPPGCADTGHCPPAQK